MRRSLERADETAEEGVEESMVGGGLKKLEEDGWWE